MFAKNVVALAIVASMGLASAQLTTTASASSGTATQADISAITAYGVPAASGLAGSVVSADACATTVVVACEDSDAGICATIGTLSYTLVEQASAFNVMFSGVIADGASFTATDSCRLSTSASVTTAVCVVSASVSADGKGSSTKTTTTVSGSSLAQNALPITAGNDKLATATGSCTSNAAAPTFMAEIYKVLVPVGAVAMGAAML